MSPADWRLFASAMTLGLGAQAVSSEHVASRILTDERQRKGTIVQYVASQPPLAFEAPFAAAMLDAHLQSIASSTTL